MEFDHVINSGCSLSYGTDLKDIYSRYPFLVAKHFNAKLIDYSTPGNLNEFIAGYAIAGILKLIKEKKIDVKKTLVLINWTFFTRFKYFDTDSKSYFIFTKERLFYKWFQDRLNTKNFSLEDLESYCIHHHSERVMIYNSLKEIYYMQLFLQSVGIENFVFSFPNKPTYDYVKGWIWDNHREDKFNKETRKEFITPPVTDVAQQINDSKTFKIFIEDMTDRKGYPRGVTDHPMEEAHVDYSSQLIKFIEELYD